MFGVYLQTHRGWREGEFNNYIYISLNNTRYCASPRVTHDFKDKYEMDTKNTRTQYNTLLNKMLSRLNF